MARYAVQMLMVRRSGWATSLGSGIVTSSGRWRGRLALFFQMDVGLGGELGEHFLCEFDGYAVVFRVKTGEEETEKAWALIDDEARPCGEIAWHPHPSQFESVAERNDKIGRLCNPLALPGQYKRVEVVQHSAELNDRLAGTSAPELPEAGVLLPMSDSAVHLHDDAGESH